MISAFLLEGKSNTKFVDEAKLRWSNEFDELGDTGGTTNFFIAFHYFCLLIIEGYKL